MVIYNDTQKEHRSAVLRIIRKLADARLQLDFDKSEFEGGIIKYLGYLIETGRGLLADPEKQFKNESRQQRSEGFVIFLDFAIIIVNSLMDIQGLRSHLLD